MPFTPYHLGFALLVGYFFRRKIHWPTFILASVVVDLEPFLVFIDVLERYPLHGYMHSFLLGSLSGLLLGYAMYTTRKMHAEFFKRLALVENEIGLAGYLVGGVVGWDLHILVDSPLYTDIKPFYPVQANPLYNAWGYPKELLFLLLFAGILLYIFHVFKNAFKRSKML
ncbi:MAG: hydrolase [Ignisphaera sp.]